MKTPPSKTVGLVLLAASLALFCWLAYEPAVIASALRLDNVASEAAVVVATLAVVATGVASGVFLALRASPVRR